MLNNNFGTIIVFGPPGAGKGTQANLLADKFNFYHLETSKLLEDKFSLIGTSSEVIEADNEKISLEEEKRKFQEGELCSPLFVAWLVQEKIKQLAKDGRGIIFSGSPRTLYEAERIAPLLKELYGESVIVFAIKLSAEASIFRNSHRKICSFMRHPILYSEETKNLTRCPLDGSELLKREGLDDPETIKNRLEVYKKQTFPVLEYLKNNGIEVKEINGEQAVEEVFNEIIEKII